MLWMGEEVIEEGRKHLGPNDNGSWPHWNRTEAENGPLVLILGKGTKVFHAHESQGPLKKLAN